MILLSCSREFVVMSVFLQGIHNNWSLNLFIYGYHHEFRLCSVFVFDDTTYWSWWKMRRDFGNRLFMESEKLLFSLYCWAFLAFDFCVAMRCLLFYFVAIFVSSARMEFHLFVCWRHCHFVHDCNKSIQIAKQWWKCWQCECTWMWSVLILNLWFFLSSSSTVTYLCSWQQKKKACWFQKVWIPLVGSTFWWFLSKINLIKIKALGFNYIVASGYFFHTPKVKVDQVSSAIDNKWTICL